VLVPCEAAVPPDPIAIAARLAGAGPLSLLHSAAPYRPGFDEVSFVAIEPERTSTSLDPREDDDEPLSHAPTLAGVPRWIGLIPYETRRILERARWVPEERRPAPWLVLPSWRRFSRRRPRGTSGRAGHGLRAHACRRAARLARFLEQRSAPAFPAVHLDVGTFEPPALHAERVARVRELIAAGDLYQVNLARPLRLGVRGDAPSSHRSALAIYAGLVAASPTAFSSFHALGDGTFVASTSPELLLAGDAAKSNDGAVWSRLRTIPIKGTRPRGADPLRDDALRAELDADPKERAELAMILDVVRNDLHRVAELGSVRIVAGPEVVTHRTVLHREALLEAVPRVGVSRRDILEALVPSGSVTGAPKVRAMEVIASLEPARRGLYTGGLGYVAQDGALVLAMAIRTAVFRGDEGVYWTGGGIVAGSDPARELAETEWKAAQLQALVKGTM
jgi:anthranilate/para-aminobenzoate synthase component I